MLDKHLPYSLAFYFFHLILKQDFLFVEAGLKHWSVSQVAGITFRLVVLGPVALSMEYSCGNVLVLNNVLNFETLQIFELDNFKELMKNLTWVWWPILPLGKWWQKVEEFKASLGYIGLCPPKYWCSKPSSLCYIQITKGHDGSKGNLLREATEFIEY